MKYHYVTVLDDSGDCKAVYRVTPEDAELILDVVKTTIDGSDYAAHLHTTAPVLHTAPGARARLKHDFPELFETEGDAVDDLTGKRRR